MVKKSISFEQLENTMLLNELDQVCDYDIASVDKIIIIKSKIATWREKHVELPKGKGAKE